MWTRSPGLLLGRLGDPSLPALAAVWAEAEWCLPFSEALGLWFGSPGAPLAFGLPLPSLCHLKSVGPAWDPFFVSGGVWVLCVCVFR